MTTDNVDEPAEKIGFSGYIGLVSVIFAISVFFVFAGDFRTAGTVFVLGFFLSLIVLYIYGADKLNRLSIQKFDYKPVNIFYIGLVGLLGWGIFLMYSLPLSMLVLFILLVLILIINVKKTSAKYAALSLPLSCFAAFCLPLVIYAFFMSMFRPTGVIVDALKGEEQCKKEVEEEKKRQKYLW